jgi:hypothetical protein
LVVMIEGIAHELGVAEPRPTAESKATDKKNYAERLSRSLATKFANGLRPSFRGIVPDEVGKRQEAPARTAKGFKKLDVGYSTIELGLALGVSIKTLNFTDGKSSRFTKNFTRIDNELRAEATDYHLRQPFAVLAAIFFLPVEACDDGSKNDPSSFGAAVRLFRNRSGRQKHTAEADLFERMYIGLYEHAPGTDRHGAVAYFDVMQPPPWSGRPQARKCLTFEGLISEIKTAYDWRNDPPFVWDPPRGYNGATADDFAPALRRVAEGPRVPGTSSRTPRS